MKSLPPFDLHCHVETTISAQGLLDTGAVVFPVTRTLTEGEAAAKRLDRAAAWAVGVHPGLLDALSDFSIDRFGRIASRLAAVGEVGLDRRSKAPIERQLDVLHQVLDWLESTPRIVTLHGAGVYGQLIDTVADHHVAAPVLHWWRGTAQETRQAIELGAYFSVNQAMTADTAALELLPRDRVVFETDHPYGDRRVRGAHPGNVLGAERAMAQIWHVSEAEVRLQAWRNLDSIINAVGVEKLLPQVVRSVCEYARTSR